MSTTIPLKIALTADRPVNLPLPKYAKPGDAGLDLVSMEDRVLRERQQNEIGLNGAAPTQDLSRALVRTGVRFEIPTGYVGLVCPRSGLAAKQGGAAILGVIDSGYRGEVMVNLVNHGNKVIEVKRGDRIAQLLLLPIASAVIEVVDDLTPSERGEGGFGHTGQ